MKNSLNISWVHQIITGDIGESQDIRGHVSNQEPPEDNSDVRDTVLPKIEH